METGAVGPESNTEQQPSVVSREPRTVGGGVADWEPAPLLLRTEHSDVRRQMKGARNGRRHSSVRPSFGN